MQNEGLCGAARERALSATASWPVTVPVVVGEKVTLMVQCAAGASDDGQLLGSANAPVAAMPVMFKLALPVFVTVTICDVLVDPTCWLANVSEAGERLATGLGALVPNAAVIGTVKFVPPASTTNVSLTLPL